MCRAPPLLAQERLVSVTMRRRPETRRPQQDQPRRPSPSFLHFFSLAPSDCVATPPFCRSLPPRSPGGSRRLRLVPGREALAPAPPVCPSATASRPCIPRRRPLLPLHPLLRAGGRDVPRPLPRLSSRWVAVSPPDPVVPATHLSPEVASSPSPSPRHLPASLLHEQRTRRPLACASR